MRKGGRPPKNPGRLKDGYYMLVSLDNLRKPIRIMSETLEQMKVVKIDIKIIIANILDR